MLVEVLFMSLVWCGELWCLVVSWCVVWCGGVFVVCCGFSVCAVVVRFVVWCVVILVFVLWW